MPARTARRGPSAAGTAGGLPSVAIIGRPDSPAEALDHFQRAWMMTSSAAIVSTVISSRQRPATTPSTAPAPAMAVAE